MLIIIYKMNYLAHAYLSFEQPEILVGNIVSDYIKGKKQYDYPLPIQKGIQLHRAIDTFTDTHAYTKQAKKYLKSAVGAYSGAFIDIVFDHYLALDINCFPTSDALAIFSENTYQTLNLYQDILPEKFQRAFPYMKQNNWLYNYQYEWGIEKSFASITGRAAYLTESEICFELWKEHYDPIKQLYQSFFPELKAYALDFLQSQNKVIH